MHAHLRHSAGALAVAPLEEMGYVVEFIDPHCLAELDDNGSPVLLPATTEAQAETVRSLREDFGCCISPVVAVVNDCSGHQTYTAIKYGASSVLNLAISVEAQVNALQAVLTAPPVPGETAVQHVRVRSLPDRPAHQVAAPRDLTPPREIAQRGPEPRAANVLVGHEGCQLTEDEADTLANLLCTDEKVCAIARRFFCSERTMYRKIRMLYDRLQVSGRSELRALRAVRAHAN